MLNWVKNRLKIGDKVLVIGLILLIALGFMWSNWVLSQGEYIEIYRDRSIVFKGTLEEQRQLQIQGKLGETKIEIKDRKIWVSNAPCPHGTCMKVGKISRTGEVIVCVPNRILIRISGTQHDVDAVTL
jgi:hypothetical protein